MHQLHHKIHFNLPHVTDVKHSVIYISFGHENVVQFNKVDFHCGNLCQEEIVWKMSQANLEYAFSVFQFLQNQATLRGGGHFQHLHIMCIMSGNARQLRVQARGSNLQWKSTYTETKCIKNVVVSHFNSPQWRMNKNTFTDNIWQFYWCWMYF